MALIMSSEIFFPLKYGNQHKIKECCDIGWSIDIDYKLLIPMGWSIDIGNRDAMINTEICVHPEVIFDWSYL